MGLVTGIVSSMLGVGGGLLIRPLLTSGFKVPEYYTSRIVRLLVLVTTVTGGVIVCSTAIDLLTGRSFRPRKVISATVALAASVLMAL